MVSFSTVVNNLDVLLDSQLTMTNQIAALSRFCFFYLRKLRSIKQSLTPQATRTLVQASVSSRLDSCNCLLAGVNNQLLDKLQRIQNAAARLVTGARSEHITPVLRHLHWLPIRQRISFKTAVLVCRCQHGMTQQYLCEPMSARSSRRLRSVSSSLLAVPARTRTNYEQTTAILFAVYGPRVWNSLPDELRSPDITLITFRNKLKSLLFNM